MQIGLLLRPWGRSLCLHGLDIRQQEDDGKVRRIVSWAVLRIHDILVWIRIRIRGSIPLTNGSGSGSFFFHHWPSICQQETKFKKNVFLHINFWMYFYIIFQRWKVKTKSQNSINQSFSYYYCLMSDPDPQHWLILRFWNNLLTTKIDLVQDGQLCQHLFDVFQRRHVVKLQGILAQRSARVLNVNVALTLVFVMSPTPILKDRLNS